LRAGFTNDYILPSFFQITSGTGTATRAWARSILRSATSSKSVCRTPFLEFSSLSYTGPCRRFSSGVLPLLAQQQGRGHVPSFAKQARRSPSFKFLSQSSQSCCGDQFPSSISRSISGMGTATRAWARSTPSSASFSEFEQVSQSPSLSRVLQSSTLLKEYITFFLFPSGVLPVPSQQQGRGHVPLPPQQVSQNLSKFPKVRVSVVSYNRLSCLKSILLFPFSFRSTSGTVTATRAWARSTRCSV
jgi:hypothetical protein